MQANFKIFGPTHLVILGAIPSVAAILAAIQRKHLDSGCKLLRFGLAFTLLLNSIVWYGYLAIRGWLTFPDSLPLELCDATLFLTFITLLNLNAAIFDLVYYGAFAGTSMALLTPDVREPFPSLSTVEFFVTHGLVLVSVLYLVWSRQARPRPGSIFRAMLAANLFAVIVGIFNLIFQTNYMYLRTKPKNPSLLDFLGPWPWYIVASEGIALLLFTLLYLPFWKPASNVRANCAK
jgi:hypothetical integral membrane protein (TIGR02206 family)